MCSITSCTFCNGIFIYYAYFPDRTEIYKFTVQAGYPGSQMRDECIGK
jgi:hypothetical protein